MTPQFLRQATGCSLEAAERFAGPLSAACAFYSIDTPVRLAAFLAQVGHESGSFRYVAELWGPTEAQKRYEGRADLGNTKPGDGKRFRGHGLIQVTGRANHARVRDRLRERFDDVPDFESEPEKLADPKWACLSACDYWDDKHLNPLADAGQFELITKRINGGLTGYEDRKARWERAKNAFKTKEEPMPLPALALPLAAAVIDIFTPLAKEKINKELARHSDSPEVVEKMTNAVIQTVQQVTGQTDPIQAVAEFQKAPELIQQVESQTLASIDQVLAVYREVRQMDREDISAAREHDKGSTEFWKRPAFWITLLLLPLVYFVVYRVLEKDAFSPEVQSMVISAVITGILGAILGYWLGSSFGSQEKTRELVKK